MLEVGDDAFEIQIVVREVDESDVIPGGQGLISDSSGEPQVVLSMDKQIIIPGRDGKYAISLTELVREVQIKSRKVWE
jgi:predicted ATP-grasp superfamily ATP-dependent carboligase